MKVAELIAELQKVPPELEVAIGLGNAGHVSVEDHWGELVVHITQDGYIGD